MTSLDGTSEEDPVVFEGRQGTDAPPRSRVSSNNNLVLPKCGPPRERFGGVRGS